MSAQRTATVGFALFLIALVTMSCDERKSSPAPDPAAQVAQPDLGAVKISLVPQQGQNVDIMIRWIPILESEEWIPRMATLVNGALVECGTPKASVDLRLWVRAGALQTPPEAGPATACLQNFLQGKELSLSGEQDREHEVLIRIAPPSIEP